jgi:hypothetical protein
MITEGWPYVTGRMSCSELLGKEKGLESRHLSRFHRSGPF